MSKDCDMLLKQEGDASHCLPLDNLYMTTQTAYS